MAQYDDNNSGVLFKNDKGDNAARPDYTGTATVEGKKYRLAAWIRESKTGGNKFLSLKLTEPQEQQSDEVKSEEAPVDESIPFNTDRQQVGQ